MSTTWHDENDEPWIPWPVSLFKRLRWVAPDEPVLPVSHVKVIEPDTEPVSE